MAGRVGLYSDLGSGAHTATRILARYPDVRNLAYFTNNHFLQIKFLKSFPKHFFKNLFICQNIE